MTKIGIFVTSTPVFGDNEKYIFLKKHGYEIFEHPSARIRSAYIAGDIKTRVNELYDLLEDDSIDILMGFWGGFNTNQILPFLDYEKFKKYPKPIVGYSDISALLLAVHKMAGIKTYMGPAAISFEKKNKYEYSLDYLERVIIKKEKEIIIKDSPTFVDDLTFITGDIKTQRKQKSKGRKIYKEGIAEGKIIASNLQTLLVLAGTPYFPDLKNKILFLEEDEEAPVQMIHRFFTHLSQVINLKEIKGICIGRYSKNSGFNKQNTEEFIYDDVFSKLKIPIIYNLDFGHTDPLITIPIGGKAYINTYENIIKFY